MEINENGKPLKSYILRRNERLSNWEENIARLQHKYLFERNDTKPRNITETLNFLEHLTYNLQLADADRSEEMKSLCWATMGMEEIYQIFRDDEITEAFCNDLGTYIIVTHRVYGRCLTNILFTHELWSSLTIRAEYDSGKALMPLTPALKLSFSTYLGNIRISLQIPPLTPSSPAFSMRRLPKAPIPLSKLIAEQQISQFQVDIITKAVKNRKNIVIAGEPGSGKTTLANALLLETDPCWRLIIIEDAREVQVPNTRFPLVTRFFMPAVGDDNRYSKRADEIARLLHRSPDYVFLGELQNREDTTVAFEGFAAGIRGLATTHSRSMDDLVLRWTKSHRIGDELLNTIDIVVFTRREFKDGIIKIFTFAVYERQKGEFVEL